MLHHKTLHPRPRKSHRLFRVLFVGLSLLMLVVLASAVTELAATDVRAKLDNAINLERDLGQLLSTVQDAETGQRGYLLTKREEYLVPYRNARDTIASVVARVGLEVLTDPKQQQRVAHIRDLIADKFGELQRAIDLTNRRDTVAVAEAMLSDRGMELMEEIRSSISALRSIESTDVTANQQQLNRMRTASLLLRLLGVLGLAFVFYYLYAQLQPLFTSISDTNTALSLKNHELDQFAYIASHDLREPLRTVSNYTQVIEEDYGDRIDEAGRQHLQLIKRTTLRMQELIESLLRYSRADELIDGKPTDLKQTVAEALENLSLSVEESGAVITIGPLPTVMGQEVALRQLFQNLIANAIKFSAAGTTPVIEITSMTQAKVVKISVKDNGIGIPPEDQDRIFGLFTRLDSRKQYHGQGIGLAFCQKIVQSHGGSINVSSEPGVGSNFTVTLPYKPFHETPEIDTAG